MPRWTRRDLLKAGLAASAGAVSLNSPAEDSGLSGESSPRPGSQTGAAHSEDSSASPRERLLLDFGWRFQLGNACDPAKDLGFGAVRGVGTFGKAALSYPFAGPKFDDSSWKSVDLPHDWAVDLPFVNAPVLPGHGGKPLGREYPETSVGWYRRVFDLPATDAGRRISVEFDGVNRHAMVIFNGHYMGENFSAYAPFRFDLTDFANCGGPNVLAVRADATLDEGWFYEGAGIYRHVWLTKTDPLHIAHWGTFVKSEARKQATTVTVSTEIENESDDNRTCQVVTRLLDANGKVAGTTAPKQVTVAAWGKSKVEAQVQVARPQLWSLEEPNLYRAVTSVESQGKLADREETTFGIRSIRFDADQGFFLNGKPVKMKGTCNHQDHAGVGAALPDRLQYYRIERLKDMGSNAYRTSHNPPTPELLDACDRLGMLVMDETRMMSSSPEGLGQLERLILRDRNHPSVVIWSIGNEEPDQGTPLGARVATSMKRMARRLDPTRLITEAMNYGWGQGLSAVVDVQGFNYAGGRGINLGQHIDEYHQKFPKQPTVGTETASTVSTRGIYENDKARGYVSAYDLNFPIWASSAQTWWQVYDARPFLCGGFAWTGFDYRGEPTPYGWPCISSHFGIMDTCGFPKDNFFYYQAWWAAKPVLHLFPHWNWSGKAGQELSVWCHTNLDSVELFLNGASQGIKKVGRNSHLEWGVKYAPGFIEARGIKNGQVVMTERRETTGEPAKLVLRPDRTSIAADGEDVSVITVEMLDAQGRTVPTASNEVQFKLTGPGRIIGVGNGDPSCHEADKPSIPTEAKRSAFNGYCMVFVQARKDPGEIKLEASGDGLQSASALVRSQQSTPRPAVA